MSKPSSKPWPKPYVLSLYTAAVEHGYIWAKPIAEADALSLRQSFYRMQRKDSSELLTPEMFMVVVGDWEPGDGSGQLPFIYSALPDGNSLPSIVAASGQQQSMRPLPAPPIDFPDQLLPSVQAEPAELDIPDISSYVSRMRANVEQADD
jgi:hypothetical protein